MSLPAASVKDAGFTLIEFCVAILILAVGILALLQTVNLAIKQNASNRMTKDAMAIADQAMSLERGNSFSAITSNVSFKPVNTFGMGYKNYSVVELVLKMPPLAPDSKKIQFTVSWKDKNGRHTHSLTTLLTDPNAYTQ